MPRTTVSCYLEVGSLRCNISLLGTAPKVKSYVSKLSESDSDTNRMSSPSSCQRRCLGYVGSMVC